MPHPGTPAVSLVRRGVGSSITFQSYGTRHRTTLYISLLQMRSESSTTYPLRWQFQCSLGENCQFQRPRFGTGPVRASVVEPQSGWYWASNSARISSMGFSLSPWSPHRRRSLSGEIIVLCIGVIPRFPDHSIRIGTHVARLWFPIASTGQQHHRPTAGCQFQNQYQ